MTYKIKLPEFEGPFDLLLFFIERDELDIYDIPISKVTDDFLEYIQNIDLINIDVASEFIIVASTLMRIKAKMLLPRKEVDESGNEIDPRDELVQRLLEYKRYKDVLIELRQLEDTRKGMHIRGNISDELFQITTKAMADAELGEPYALLPSQSIRKRVCINLTSEKQESYIQSSSSITA